jgi:multiple sugar transport system ATP-binding protein
MIYVTHDQIEAMTLADRIAVMSGGEIQQFDTPQAIYNRPVSRFVAGFIGSPGMNFLDGTIETNSEPIFRLGDTSVPVARYACDKQAAPAGTAVLGVRPEHVVYGDAAARQPFSTQGEIEVVEPMGSDTLVWSKLGNQNFSFRVDAERRLSVGDRIAIGFDPARASIFDSGSGRRL